MEVLLGVQEIGSNCPIGYGDGPHQWMDESLHRLRTPENDDSPVNTNAQWFPTALKMV